MRQITTSDKKYIKELTKEIVGRNDSQKTTYVNDRRRANKVSVIIKGGGRQITGRKKPTTKL